MLATAVAGAAWLLAVASASDATVLAPVDPAGAWAFTSSMTVASNTANQGLTTVVRDGHPVTVTRGDASIAPDLAAQGWNHIGSPGSVNGSILDAYQSSRPIGAKLFTLTTPAGVRSDYLHKLIPGELSNNSFATVAPGGRWFVSGEWGSMTRLLVFATPHPKSIPRSVPRTDQALPLATTITLTKPVRNVQGCAFTSTSSLICSTNDLGTDLYPVPRQLLAIQLARPLDGRPVTGTPRLLGAVPTQTVCAGGPGEVEGLDVYGDRLVVAVNAPCAPRTQLFTYIRARRDADIDPSTRWSPVHSPVQAIQPGQPVPEPVKEDRRA